MWDGLRNRLHNIGVKLIDTKPDTRMATLIVTANSCSSRPTMPPMKSTGMKTAVNDSVIERIVKPTSFDPSKAARIEDLPISMCRTMFSSITIASSTTKPTDRVSAISVRLLRLYPSRYIAMNVPTIEPGNARLGISVAEMFRRNRKITMITRATVRRSVNFTSRTDSRIGPARSILISRFTGGGSCSRRVGRRARTASTTATTLVPGCR